MKWMLIIRANCTSNVILFATSEVKGKCALGPFLSILVIESQHKCLSVNLCQLMDKVQIKSKGMFLRLSALFLDTNVLCLNARNRKRPIWKRLG
jgi:hypothetical protein